MEASSLRIGNYVLDRGGKTLRIDHIDFYKVYMDMFVGLQSVHPLTEYYGNLQPIPLTEEILLKCGFERDAAGFLGSDQSDTAFRSKIYVSKHGVKFFLWIECEDNYFSENGIEIESLHQLQNLYFALTGQELEVSL